MTTLTNLAAICAAVWVVEGGSATRFPYGIKSVRVESVAEAKAVCERTVKQTWSRWHKTGRPGCFYDFLALRYVGKQDPQGVKNWRKNIKARLKHRPCDCKPT